MSFLNNISGKIQRGLERLSRDADEVVRGFERYFDSLTNETRILFFIMFIMVLFYLIVRRPGDEKHSGSMGRQFLFAASIIIIFGLGIGWAMDANRISEVFQS